MGRIVLLLLVVGCKFDSPTAPDAPGDTGMTCMAWDTRGGHLGDLCPFAPAGSWRIDSPTATYDTSTASESASPRSFLVPQTGTGMLHVVTVDSFEVTASATLRVTGPHPLLVLSWGTIRIDGTIDASSRSGSLGAGGSRQGCNPADPGQGTVNGSGGGGGGLGQPGARGGHGDQITGIPVLGGSPSAMLARPAGVVVGGCRGGNGGGSGGAGGDGGGAIQLTARTSIAIGSAGRILAGGMGGGGATSNGGGGGGGGSGGFIGLDAEQVTTVTGSVLAANGGGGGAGCQAGSGGPGQDGPSVSTPALGGSGTTCIFGGVDGGNGGRRGDAPRIGTDSNYGGGGGGGGTGYVIVWSPAATMSGTRTPGEVVVTDRE